MMKRHVFATLAALVLLCLLCACFPEPEPEPEPEPPPPEKYYHTLRLVDDDDTIGISVGGDISRVSVNDGSRALTSEIALAFHDFFEVVFYYNGDGGPRIARTTWNVGETPELRGVYGKGSGETATDYRNVSGTISAVLFAGSKEDKTLLGVGHLSHVDNMPASDTNRIGTNTTAVTFEVTALKAGARFSAQRADSAFWTNYTDGPSGTPTAATTTILDNIFIHYSIFQADKKTFPLYRLRRTSGGSINANTTPGRYNFDIAAPAGYTTPTFANYVAGIVLAGGYNCEVRQPRYILSDGLYQTSSIFPQAVKEDGSSTELAVMTNNTTGTSFANPVTFTFNTVNSPDGSIFALTFEIFVYNLTSSPTTSAGSMDADPVKWRISTGIGTKWLDLDDGLDGQGGAILLGSGANNILTDRLAPYNWN